MKGMIIENEYDIGDTVYLKTDIEQYARLVTAITIRTGDNIMYEVSCGSTSSNHYGFEMARERNVVLKNQEA
ncbi:hypothetical protein KGP36_01565 [Patescibacteria group bacterium]|nr:hypothetical protein [Patescibacteria group bacterium]